MSDANFIQNTVASDFYLPNLKRILDYSVQCLSVNQYAFSDGIIINVSIAFSVTYTNTDGAHLNLRKNKQVGFFVTDDQYSCNVSSCGMNRCGNSLCLSAVVSLKNIDIGGNSDEQL